MSQLTHSIRRALAQKCTFDFAHAFRFSESVCSSQDLKDFPVGVSINKRKLLKKMADQDIFSLAQLARKIPCSQTGLHFAIETPTRFSRVISRLNKILKIKSPNEIL